MSNQFYPTDRVIVRGKQRGVITRLGFSDKVHVAVEGSTAPIVVSRYEIEHDEAPLPVPAYLLNADQQAEVDEMGEDLRNLYDDLRCGDDDVTHDQALAACAVVANERGRQR